MNYHNRIVYIIITIACLSSSINLTTDPFSIRNKQINDDSTTTGPSTSANTSINTGASTSGKISTSTGTQTSISPIPSTSHIPNTGAETSTSPVPSTNPIPTTSSIPSTSPIPSTSSVPSTSLIPSTSHIPSTDFSTSSTQDLPTSDTTITPSHVIPYTTTSSSIVSKDRPSALVEAVHDKIAEIIGITFRWADQHFPLTVKIVQLTRAMGKTQLEGIPGLRAFTDILTEAFNFHILKEKLAKYNVTSPDFTNLTIEETIEEFKKHHNYSLSDIPIMQNITKSLLQFEAVTDLMKDAMTVNVKGTPFGLTILLLINHIQGEIPVSQLTNATVLQELHRNITETVYPFIEFQANKTLNKMKDHSDSFINNLTQAGTTHINKMGDVARNITSKIYHGVHTVISDTQNATNIGTKIINQTIILQQLAKQLTDEQIDELKDHFNSLGKITSDFSALHSPMKTAMDIGERVRNYSKNTYERLKNFTYWIDHVSWSNLKEFGIIKDKVVDYSILGTKMHSLHKGLSDTIADLHEITKSMSPIEMFRFNSVDELLKSRGIDPSFPSLSMLKNMPSLPNIGTLPGYNVIISFFEHFPMLKTFSFNQLIEFLNNFRLFKPITSK